MASEKIKFSSLYNNFIEPSKMIKKYWLFGWESEGEVNWGNKGYIDPLFSALEAYNENEVSKILSNFNEEYAPSSIFHKNSKKVFNALDELDNNLIENQFTYTTFYRSNVSPLVFPNDENVIFREYMRNDRYKKYIDFEDYTIEAKDDFYKQLQLERVNAIKSSEYYTEIKSKLEIVFFMMNTRSDSFISNFMNTLFETDYKLEFQNGLVYLYSSEKENNPKLILLPQSNFFAYLLNEVIERINKK
jgi:hypothetical protein